MKQVILRVPEALEFDMLTEEQQGAIRSVFGQFVFMPGTIPANGYKLVDALTADNFNPAVMSDFGLDWPLLFLGRWDGVPGSDWDEIIIPLDADDFINFLPEPAEGPKVLHIPHGWAGWPPVLTG